MSVLCLSVYIGVNLQRIINENYVCKLFAHNAQRSLVKIFSMYFDDVVSTCNLRSVISDVFFR